MPDDVLVIIALVLPIDVAVPLRVTVMVEVPES